MRIVSLLPSATEIVFALGLGDELVGVSHDCDFPPQAREIPFVTRPRGPGPTAPGLPWLAPDEVAISDVRPDLVLVAGARETEGLARRLGPDVSVVRLEPTSVEGILNSISTVGAMTEAEDAAVDVVEELRERLQAVEEIVVGRRDHGFAPPRVAALGWLDPPYAVGRWVPEQVRLAGGWELLGHEAGSPAVTSWDAVRETDPEVLVLMPAGLHLHEAVRAWTDVPRPAGWGDLRAVRDGRVFAVDGAAHFWRPGPRIVDGIEVLAELFDPLAFDGMSPPDSWARVG
ncbi:MAG: ABC transporter substrate-binding protein [Chloroflexota bacterium]